MMLVEVSGFPAHKRRPFNFSWGLTNHCLKSTHKEALHEMALLRKIAEMEICSLCNGIVVDGGADGDQKCVKAMQLASRKLATTDNVVPAELLGDRVPFEVFVDLMVYNWWTKTRKGDRFMCVAPEACMHSPAHRSPSPLIAHLVWHCLVVVRGLTLVIPTHTRYTGSSGTQSVSPVKTGVTSSRSSSDRCSPQLGNCVWDSAW
jgi:hypothetical protein